MKDISNIRKNEHVLIKTKLRSSCEKYCNIKVPKHQKKFLNNLMKTNKIIIMKQDKGRGVVNMNKNKYIEKGLTLQSTKQFQKLNIESTISTEKK